jgi:hypothetical protein
MNAVAQRPRALRAIAKPALVAIALLAVAVTVGACEAENEVGSRPANDSGPAASPPAAGTGWTPLDPGGDGSELLGPGRYGLRANGLPGMPWAVVDVPAGLANLGGWLVLDPDIVRAVGYWTISGVDRDPCGEPVDLIDPGTSVEDLVDAFAAQALTDMTSPVPVEVGGHRGLYVELRAPDDLDFATCGQGKFETWLSDPAGGRYMQQPGQVDRLWILDVNGDRVVLFATAVPDVPEAQVEQLTGIVESTRFVKAPQ